MCWVTRRKKPGEPYLKYYLADHFVTVKSLKKIEIFRPVETPVAWYKNQYQRDTTISLVRSYLKWCRYKSRNRWVT